MLGRPLLRLGSGLASTKWICVILITVGLRKGGRWYLCICNGTLTRWLLWVNVIDCNEMSFELSENRSRVGERVSKPINARLLMREYD